MSVIDFPAIEAEIIDDAIVPAAPPLMNTEEAEFFEARIIKTAEALGAMLTAFRDREGWRALGYDSWTAYLNSGRLNAHRSTLYRALKDFRLSQIETFDGLNASQKRALDQFPEQHQATIRAAAAAGNAKLTAGRIADVGDNIMQAIHTGHVDDDDGNPLNIANKASDRERKQRQQEHIRDGLRSKRDAFDVVIVPDAPEKTAAAISGKLKMADLDALVQALVSERWRRVRAGERSVM